MAKHQELDERSYRSAQQCKSAQCLVSGVRKRSSLQTEKLTHDFHVRSLCVCVCACVKVFGAEFCAGVVLTRFGCEIRRFKMIRGRAVSAGRSGKASARAASRGQGRSRRAV